MRSFLDNLPRFRSVAIVGLAKNAGKTECLNYLLEQLSRQGLRTGVTSIGVDGETTDAVTLTKKPEITLSGGTLLVTSESFYRQRRLVSEIKGVGKRATALGRQVYAEVKVPGRVILAGPPDTATLKDTLSRLHEMGAVLTLVDGALSRLSLGAPEVTDALILATGAAVSPSPQEIVRRTAFVVELMSLPEMEPMPAIPAEFTRGIAAIDGNGEFHDLKVPTALAISKMDDDLYRYGNSFYVAGAVTDRILDSFHGETTVVIRDFSCMFAGPQSYRAFKARGGRLMVRKRCRLIGLTVNPISPQGYRVDSGNLCRMLEEATGLPAVDIRRINNEQ